ALSAARASTYTEVLKVRMLSVTELSTRVKALPGGRPVSYRLPPLGRQLFTRAMLRLEAELHFLFRIDCPARVVGAARGCGSGRFGRLGGRFRAARATRLPGRSAVQHGFSGLGRGRQRFCVQVRCVFPGAREGPAPFSLGARASGAPAPGWGHRRLARCVKGAGTRGPQLRRAGLGCDSDLAMARSAAGGGAELAQGDRLRVLRGGDPWHSRRLDVSAVRVP